VTSNILILSNNLINNVLVRCKLKCVSKSLKIQIRNFLTIIPITDKSWADDFLRKISLGGYVILASAVMEKSKMKALELARVKIWNGKAQRYNE